MRLFVLKPSDESNRAEDVYGWFQAVGTYEIAVLASDEDEARSIVDAHEASEGFPKTRSGLWLDKVAVECREIDLMVAGIVIDAQGTG